MGDILIVSTTDINRGPMLEGFIRQRLRKYVPGAECASRGINVVAPRRCSTQTISVMKNEYGIDVGGHIARSLSIEDLKAALAVVCVSAEHQRYIAAVYPDFAPKTHLIQTPLAIGAEPLAGEDGTIYSLCAAHLRDCAERLNINAIIAREAGH